MPYNDLKRVLRLVRQSRDAGFPVACRIRDSRPRERQRFDVAAARPGSSFDALTFDSPVDRRAADAEKTATSTVLYSPLSRDIVNIRPHTPRRRHRAPAATPTLALSRWPRPALPFVEQGHRAGRDEDATALCPQAQHALERQPVVKPRGRQDRDLAGVGDETAPYHRRA
jgi:hypothetical protein